MEKDEKRKILLIPQVRRRCLCGRRRRKEIDIKTHVRKHKTLAKKERKKETKKERKKKGKKERRAMKLH